MILVGLGSNVAGRWGTPLETVEMALGRLDVTPLRLVAASRLLVTSPMGLPDQPPFVNAVARIETTLSADDLLDLLHGLEDEAERRRLVRWGPRTLDLDLLDYNGYVRNGDPEGHGHDYPLILPHPGIQDRPFVLTPIAEIAPQWRHPVLDQTAAQLMARLAPDAQGAEITPRQTD